MNRSNMRNVLNTYRGDGKTGCLVETFRRCLRRHETRERRGRRAVANEQGAVARSASQKPYCRLLPVQDVKDRGLGVLLSRSLVHAGERDGVVYERRRSSEEEANPRLILRVLREDGRSVYIEKGRLIRAPARSLLHVTEPDKSRVTYPDSTPFARTGFFGTFPKQNESEFAAKQNCKRRLHLRKDEEPIFRTIRRVRRARAPPALPCPARPGEARRASARVCFPSSLHHTCFKWLGGHPPF